MNRGSVTLLMLCYLLTGSVSLPAALHERSLLRAKRLEEIVYGNMQNGIRVKKAGPAPPLADKDPAPEAVVFSVTKTITADAPPEEETHVENSSHVDNIDKNEAPADKEDERLEEDVLEEEAETGNGSGEETVDTEVEDLQGLTEEDSLKDLEDQEVAAEKSTNVDVVDNTDAMTVEEWFKKIYQPYFLSQEHRLRRSAAGKLPLTAEHMTDMSKTPERVKRDLTDDELEAWLEEDSLSPYAYNRRYEDDDDDNDDEADTMATPDETTREYLHRLFDGDESPEEDYYGYDDVMPRQYPMEFDKYEPPNDESNAALLRYLYNTDKDEDSIQESYRDLDELQPEEDDIEFEQITYDGVPGIFIPEKRQYMSLVPGLRKRGNGFYPASFEPSTSARWNAFIPELIEQKRTADEYERLYRLAQALGQKRDRW